MVLRLDGALAVHRLAQGVDHAADQGLADGHGHDGAGALHRVALADALVRTEHDDGDGVFLQVQGHAVLAVGEAHQFIRHAGVQAGRPGNTVADHDDGAGVILGNLVFVVLDLLFDQLGNLFRFQLHVLHRFLRLCPK